MLRVAGPVTVMVACAGIALAAPPQPVPTVTVYSPPSGEALAGRLQAELYAVGIEARMVPIAEEATTGEPGARDEARAVIRIAPGGNGTEVWVADPGGAGTLRQSLVSTSRTMAAVVALRTMEFLRASLLPEPQTARRPALAAPLPPRSQVSALIVASPQPSEPLAESSLRISIGPALVMSPGGLSAMGAASMRVAWNPHRVFGAELLGVVALTSAQVDTSEGSSHFWSALAGAGGTAVLPVTSRVELDAGAGMFGMMARARGEANQSYLGGSASTYAAAGYGRLGVTARATDHLGVRADALAGFTVQRLLVSVVPRGDVADWGRPLVAATLSLQAAW